MKKTQKKMASEVIHSSKPVANLLVAFPYFTPNVRDFFREQDPSNFRLIVDSGGFTAYMQGKPIKLDDYCRFLDSISFLRPFHAVQLDVIGDHAKTLQNYETMRKRGYEVLPVFTRGSPLDLVDELYRNTDYILIGGVAFGEQRRNYVKHLFPKLKDRKYHLLGFTDLDFIKTLRPYSVDSSACYAGARYGRLMLYEGFGKIRSVGREVFFPKVDPSIERCFLKMGLSSKEMGWFRTEKGWRGNAGGEFTEHGAIRFVGLYASLLQSLDIEKHLSTKYHLVMEGTMGLKAIFRARMMIEQKMKEGLL